MKLEEVIKFVERRIKKLYSLNGGVFGDGKNTYVTDGVIVYKTRSSEGVEEVPPIILLRMEQFDSCKEEYDVETLDLTGETVKIGTCYYDSSLVRYMKKVMGKRAKYYFSENFAPLFDLCGATNENGEFLLISLRRGAKTL